MSWTLYGHEIHNAEGHKLASAAYGRTRGCSQKVSPEERQEALELMAQAPAMWAALHAALPLLIELGDYIGNGPLDPNNPQSLGRRCDVIAQVRAAMGEQ